MPESKVEQLLRLRTRYRLGIFTSSTLKTLKKGLGLIYSQLAINSRHMAAMGERMGPNFTGLNLSNWVPISQGVEN